MADLDQDCVARCLLSDGRYAEVVSPPLYRDLVEANAGARAAGNPDRFAAIMTARCVRIAGLSVTTEDILDLPLCDGVSAGVGLPFFDSTPASGRRGC